MLRWRFYYVRGRSRCRSILFSKLPESVLHSVLKSMGKEDLANLAALAGLAVVLFVVIDLLVDLFTYVKTVFLLY